MPYFSPILRATISLHWYHQLHSRRDAEIVRAKKLVLRSYLEQTGETKSRKRSLVAEQPTPRPKFRRVSVQLWKDACQSAPCYDHEMLPTLEEATQLFGYASQ